MVTEEQVWNALAEIPDPEIPVISLVDLGVIRSVDVSQDQVRVEFTPTFLGCPALEVMRDAMAARISALGADAQIEVISDDSWSTDRITPEGREKLRASGFAPPLPRCAWERFSGRPDEPRALLSGGASAASAREVDGPKLVQLQSNAFRCPYCGSQDTTLENIFGPTPCRSVRYCRSCRQPFEQFKTI